MKNKVAKNATWIVVCRVIQALLGLVVSMLTARYLGPSNYGTINYAAALIAFVLPIMHLGITSVIVQEFVDNPEDEGKAIGTSMLMMFISSIVCTAGVISFAAIANKGETETIIVCALYSISLVVQVFEITTYWFQAHYLAKYTSLIATGTYLIVSGYKIFLLATEKNIYWFAVSNALDYLIISIGIFIAYKKLGGQRLQLSSGVAKRLIKKSKYYIISDLMVVIFVQTDRIMLKLMLGETATGYYSAAATTAALTGFVFSAIIDSARPTIFESAKDNKERYERNMVRLYSIIIYLSLLQCVVMTVFANLIINILYGADYHESAEILQLMVWYTTFSYIGSVRNIWILSEGHQKYLWVINLSGAAANVVLNFVLIPIMGTMGAALASLVTQMFTNVIVGFIIRPIRHNNLLMFKSLNPKVLVDVYHTLRK